MSRLLTRSQTKGLTVRHENLVTPKKMNKGGKKPIHAVENLENPPQAIDKSEVNMKRESPMKMNVDAVVKKLKISEDEKSMCGAPEGDLFDVTVQNDSELLPLPESPSITEQFQAACTQYNTTNAVTGKVL